MGILLIEMTDYETPLNKRENGGLSRKVTWKRQSKCPELQQRSGMAEKTEDDGQKTKDCSDVPDYTRIFFKVLDCRV